MTAGGGGWGDPLEREPALVRADVREGYVSAQSAREDYGAEAANRLPFRPQPQRRHVGLDPSFVEKDQPRRIDPVLMRLPATPLAGDVRPVLLRRKHGFF